MELLKGSNLLVRFLLELCMLAAIGYWGFKTNSSWAMKIVFGVGLPLLVAVLWGLFLAPKATHPLTGMSHLALEIFLFGAGAFALFAVGRADLGFAYAAVLVVNKVLMLAWKQ
jgi:hypothetical protein